MKRFGMATAALLICAAPAASQDRAAGEPPHTAGVAGGVWNVGHGFHPAWKAYLAIPLSSRVSVEATGWLLRRPRVWCTRSTDREWYPECARMVSVTGMNFGVIVDLEGPERVPVTFVGVSIGMRRGAGTLNGHLGARQELTDVIGLRLEGVGTLSLYGSAYQLLAGTYVRF